VQIQQPSSALIIILKKLQRKYSFDDFQERLYNADEI
jgi:hypothetical protein